MQSVSTGAQNLKEVRVSLCLTLNNFTKSLWKDAFRYIKVPQVALTLYTAVFMLRRAHMVADGSLTLSTIHSAALIQDLVCSLIIANMIQGQMTKLLSTYHVYIWSCMSTLLRNQ